MSMARTTESRREEAFRSLRSTIKFAAGEPAVRSVLIVDTDRNETSDSAEQVARAFAKAGDSCAFVNADFRSGGEVCPDSAISCWARSRSMPCSRRMRVKGY